MEQRHLIDTDQCHRVTGALARVGNKWAVLLLMQLDEGPKRFNELRRTLGGISQKMLASTLQGLERDGFITRTVLPTKPPGTEYTLTELGEELVIPVKALGVWVLENIGRVEKAREEFDRDA